MLKKYFASAFVAMGLVAGGVAHAADLTPGSAYEIKPAVDGTLIYVDGVTTWDVSTSSLVDLVPLTAPTGVTEFAFFSAGLDTLSPVTTPITYTAAAMEGDLVMFSLISADHGDLTAQFPADELSLTFNGCTTCSTFYTSTQLAQPGGSYPQGSWFGFYAGAGTTSFTLTLTNGDEFNAAVGAVAVVPVPEPETYALMAAGLGVIGTLARRRRKQEQEA